MNKSLPDYKDLILLEKIARSKGSGIEHNNLIGCWRFKTVWKKGSSEPDSISSTFLQVLFAKFELSKLDENSFEIANSIKFGVLFLRFSGIANLERKQPILYFSFDKLELFIGSTRVFQKKFDVILKKNKKPFFALIAISENFSWLSARGKGGGLAIWTNEKFTEV